jgi:GT2 family glycosyltransferase
MPAKNVSPSRSPRVALLILNQNGREHLEACLPSVLAQDYPASAYSVEVIDNGSTDGSIEWLRRKFPSVVCHRLERNLGFAAAYDDVIRQSSSEYIALLNNDTRVEPNWLTELVSAAGRHHADCVGAKILDWDGRRIDFAGAVTSFIGHSWQVDHGMPADRSYEERPLLFACGGAALISREAYLASGGLDREFFAYFEDVDLGWRMALLGYTTVFAPQAVTYHRLHGTASRVPFAARLRLYERNALAMLYKNYEDETLRRVLPAAVALCLLRGLRHSGLDADSFRLGAPAPTDPSISARLAAHLLALEDFSSMLPVLQQRRADIQRRRTVPDAEIVKLFGDPFRLHEGGDYEQIARTLIRDLGLDEIFPAPAGTVPVPAAAVDLPVAIHTDRAAGEPSGDPEPLVSIVILTVLGATHLEECLTSLRTQTYPAHAREVIVVDNGSADDPSEQVARDYPGARVIRTGKNIGFSAANNLGARAGRGKYVVFLNDDTRLDPDWLFQLVATTRRRGAASAGSRIVTWDGSKIDFVGGVVNCEGKGFQTDTGSPDVGRHTEEVPLLFGCGAAVLVDRELFLAIGGMDEGAWMYYEDVELGWRLWLLGHEVWFSPRSIVFHKHHGTWGRWPEPPRLRLYERNSLRVLYTHLERSSLGSVLSAALLLAADRALLATNFSRAARDEEEASRDRDRGGAADPPRLRTIAANFKAALRQRGVTKRESIVANARRVGPRGLGGALRQALRGAAVVPAPSRRLAYDLSRGMPPADLDSRREPLPPGAAAALLGLHDFLMNLPALGARRAWLQSARRR